MAQNLHRRVSPDLQLTFFTYTFGKHVLDYAKNRVMLRRFLKALAAVLAGAGILWIFKPHLPRGAQHQIFHDEPRLLIYGLLSAATFWLAFLASPTETFL